MTLAPPLGFYVLLVASLQFKHFICDGPLQTKAMVDAKRHYGRGLGLVHAGLHGLGTGLVMLVALGPLPLVLLLALVDFVIHYHVDFAKEGVAHARGWTPAQGPFWWAISLDQMLHQFTYLGLALWAMPAA